jgi:hypothetical protein
MADHQFARPPGRANRASLPARKPQGQAQVATVMDRLVPRSLVALAGQGRLLRVCSRRRLGEANGFAQRFLTRREAAGKGVGPFSGGSSRATRLQD